MERGRARGLSGADGTAQLLAWGHGSGMALRGSVERASAPQVGDRNVLPQREGPGTLQAPDYNQGSLCSECRTQHSPELRPAASASAGWVPGPDLPGAAGSWCRQFPAEHSCPVLAGGPVRHRPSLGVGGPSWSGSCCGGACGKRRGGSGWASERDTHEVSVPAGDQPCQGLCRPFLAGCRPVTMAARTRAECL